MRAAWWSILRSELRRTLDEAQIATIGASNAVINFPAGVALDPGGNIYVSNAFGSAGKITVYAAGSSGDVPPTATISGGATELCGTNGIALDSSGNILATNGGCGRGASITTYPAGSNGDVSPSATISGIDTGLSTPLGITLDSAGNIYVANFGPGLPSGSVGSVTVYPPGSAGDSAPLAIIVGQNTALLVPQSIALDSSDRI